MEKVDKAQAVQWYAQNRGLYKKLSQKIHNIIVEVLEKSGITIHAVTDRTKDVDSFKNKIENTKYDDPLNQITDLAGIRIIAYVENDLKPICKIIEDIFDIDEVNSSDKSDDLGIDRVGYKSIHYIAKIKKNRIALPEYKKFKALKFEIQIRTILQHAWAEIEHDRNYKFNGVLPLEITRRFKILAGTLELIDREFNQLSVEIDKIATSVTVAVEEDKLDNIIISSTTLKQFLTNKLQQEINSGIMKPDLYNEDDLVIKELNNFGIQTLGELNKIFPEDFSIKMRAAFNTKKPSSFLGLIRDLMIINNCRKYFDYSWGNSWGAMDAQTVTFYTSFNVDCDLIINGYGIMIV